MRILYVHERFGALAGAEANAHITATELGVLNHTVGILHGESTGKHEAAWNTTFTHQFPLHCKSDALAVRNALAEFRPDVIYVHKMSDLKVIETLVRQRIAARPHGA